VLTIKKVLNSSVVLVHDEHGRESILLGKGIGYGQKPGTEVPERSTDQIFIPMANPDAKNLMDLLASIPATYIDLTRETVRYAEAHLGVTLHPHIYLALTDHLNFAVERARQGIPVVNRLAWEVRTFYPKEYAVGVYALNLLRERVDVDLPEEEAANIAFHITNAHQGGDSFDAIRATKLIGAVVTIVRYAMHVQFTEDDLHYSRFISHMQYFAARFFTNRMLVSADDFLYTQIANRYPDAVECAERVRTHILTEYNEALPNEEVAFLAVHIQRLSTP